MRDLYAPRLFTPLRAMGDLYAPQKLTKRENFHCSSIRHICFFEDGGWSGKSDT